MRPVINSGIYDMLSSRFDEMGHFIKMNESMWPVSGRFEGGKPLVVRLDGSGFSKYTKDLERPFDLTYRQIMVDVSKELARYYQADVYYTQSDEITLVWFNMSYIGRDGFNNVLPFGGRYQKIVSEMAGYCTSLFNVYTFERMPHKRGQIAFFDARAYQPNSDDIALLSLRWRVLDSMKNAVNQCVYYLEPNHKKFNNVNTAKRIEYLISHETFNWSGLDSWLKDGTLMYKTLVQRTVSDSEKIPEQYRTNLPVYKSDWVSGIELFNKPMLVQPIINTLYGKYTNDVTSKSDKV